MRSFDTPEPAQKIVLLRNQIEEGTVLLDSGSEVSLDDYSPWMSVTRDMLERVFGKDSLNVSSVMAIGKYGGSPADKLRKQIKQLEKLIKLLPKPEAGVAPRASAPVAGHKIFLVHGHDEVLHEVARFLGHYLGRQEDVIVLGEQPNQGRTIIEKFEDCSAEVGFAVVLLTPDDRGGPTDTSFDQQQQRARQNVILELGYFLNHLGRKRVCVLHSEGVEIPSDYKGVAYINLDKTDGWQPKLTKELEAAGFPVDMNRAVQQQDA